MSHASTFASAITPPIPSSTAPIARIGFAASRTPLAYSSDGRRSPRKTPNCPSRRLRPPRDSTKNASFTSHVPNAMKRPSQRTQEWKSRGSPPPRGLTTGCFGILLLRPAWIARSCLSRPGPGLLFHLLGSACVAHRSKNMLSGAYSSIPRPATPTMAASRVTTPHAAQSDTCRPGRLHSTTTGTKESTARNAPTASAARS
jgi:hypothetical protein